MKDEFELVDAIRKGDYKRSFKLLLDVIREGRTQEIADFFDPIMYEGADLRLRDHISALFSLNPVYCAVEIASYNLLKQADRAKSREESAQMIYEYISDLVRKKDSAINLQGFRLDRIENSVFVMIAPEIIEQRTHEILNCKVLFTQKGERGKSRKVYYVKDLFDTAYGRLLTYADHKIHRSIVGESMWGRIAGMVEDIGFSPDSMLIEIENDKWHDTVKPRRSIDPARVENGKINPEVVCIRGLNHNYRDLILGDSSDMIIALKGIRSLQTSYCNRELIELMPSMDEIMLGIVIDILVDTRYPGIDEILKEFLDSTDSEKRKIGSYGISRMNQIDWPNHGFHYKALDIRAIEASTAESIANREHNFYVMRNLAIHSYPQVKIEIIKVLAEMNDIDSQNVIVEMIKDESEKVRLEVLAHVQKLRKEIAGKILKQALSDPSEKVTSEAKRIIGDVSQEFE
ncbi:MAG: HEAT repeat domain-containing protein [Candidatus Thorarchaeota archaeon]